jgi:hypothetical protein
MNTLFLIELALRTVYQHGIKVELNCPEFPHLTTSFRVTRSEVTLLICRDDRVAGFAIDFDGQMRYYGTHEMIILEVMHILAFRRFLQ